MYAFTFHRPQTVRQAASLLGKNEDAKLLAGGQTLLPTMKLRLAGPPQIVDMSLIEGLSGIEQSGRSLDHRRDDAAITTSTPRQWCSRRRRCWPSLPA